MLETVATWRVDGTSLVSWSYEYDCGVWTEAVLLAMPAKYIQGYLQYMSYMTDCHISGRLCSDDVTASSGMTLL